MSWSITASGHADDAAERALAAALGAALHAAGPAVSTAQFYGTAVQGDPRDLVPVPEGNPASDSQAAAPGPAAAPE